MELKPTIEIIRGEGLKSAAEIALWGLGKFAAGEKALEFYAHGLEGRIDDPALHTTVAGVTFDNPVMVGAGWDKKGRAIRGLYHLGFSAVEVGTVPLFGQPGNLKPRIGTVGKNHSVGWNRLGFNSPGSEAVDRYLEAQTPYPCPVGINVGKNKLMPEDQSPWAHGEVVRNLYDRADYFVFNPSSPNTPGLRDLQQTMPLRAHVKAMRQAMMERGAMKPLFVKISPDMTMTELYELIDVCVEEGVDGIIATNTTTNEKIKNHYGLKDMPGGLSGNATAFREIALRMTIEIYERAGDELEHIGVGAVSTAEHAIERMLGGASLVQVVTGIREHNGRVAAQINRGIQEWMGQHGVKNIQEIIGAGTKRGVRPKAA